MFPRTVCTFLYAERARIMDAPPTLEEMIESLLARRDTNGDSPLHLAVQAELGGMVRPLIEEMDVATSTVPQIASRLEGFLANHPPTVLTVAQQLQNNDGYMPIHLAVANGAESVCEVLLKTGALVNAYTLKRSWQMHPDGHSFGFWARRNKSGTRDTHPANDQTPLHLAVHLVADQTTKDSNVETDLGVARVLLEHGADVNALDYWRRTPLHIAVTSGLYEMVELLASSARGCLSGEEHNSSALHLATVRNDARMVKLLLQHGALIDARGTQGHGGGWTPLCLAARSGAVDVAKMLISAGANIHATSANNKTAYEIANINSSKQNSQLVLEVLHLEMLSYVLDIAIRRRPAVPTAPSLAASAAPIHPPIFELPAQMLAAQEATPALMGSVLLLHAQSSRSSVGSLLFAAESRIGQAVGG